MCFCENIEGEDTSFKIQHLVGKMRGRETGLAFMVDFKSTARLQRIIDPSQLILLQPILRSPSSATERNNLELKFKFSCFVSINTIFGIVL